MKIQDAISDVNALKPSQYDDMRMMKWLSDLDMKIWDETISWHENASERPAEYTDKETTLLVVEPYSELYIMYLSAQVDYWNGEYGRYNNSMAMFNTKLDEFARWYNKTHMPKQDVYIEV